MHFLSFLFVTLVLVLNPNSALAAELKPGIVKDKLLYVGNDSHDTTTRNGYLARATLWQPVNLDQMDLRSGRQTKGTLPNDSTVECNYVKETHLGGTTNKFKCDLIKAVDSTGRTLDMKPTKLKVRYSHKVFSSVITTRLAWAFGFGGDIETPVARLICHGCGDDPFTQTEAVAGIKEFNTVAIEQKFPAEGPGIYQTGARYSHDDGEPSPAWYWDELKIIDKKYGEDRLAQADALKLFAAFIKDGDTKAVQNVFVCLEAIGNDGICHSPYLYVHDLGNTLGTDGLSVHPLDLLGWGRSRVWKDEAKCVADVRNNGGNGAGLTYPQISEKGRQLFASMLDNLVNRHESKLRDIFDAAHIEKYDDHGKHFSADNWVKAFRLRAEKIIYMKNACPAP